MTDETTCRALASGAEAAGARFVRPGFAVDAETDLAFALGWPYLRRLVAGHPAEALTDPEARAKSILAIDEHGVDLPADFARRRARALAVWNIGPGGRPPEVEAALANDAPLDEAEARALVTGQVSATTWITAGVQEEIVLCLEALVGPAGMLDAILGALEAVDPAGLRDLRHVRASYAWYVGLGLLRVSPAAAETAKARAAALLASAGAAPMGSAAHWLDLAVSGGAALERTERPYGAFAIHAVDAPELVAATVTREPIDPTFQPRARLSFLGGDAVVDHYAGNHKKVKQPAWLAHAARDHARMRSPRALSFVLELAASSKAKKEALSALIEQAAHTRPFLEATASAGGPQAAAAKAVLAKFPKR